MLFLPFMISNITFDSDYNACLLQTNTKLFKSLTYVIAIILIVISFGIDALITFSLLFMFVYRLCKMKNTQSINISIKKQIKKQVVIGILCTSTSAIMTVFIIVFGYKVWYFLCIDQIINTLGVVLTFDFDCYRVYNYNNNPYQVDSQAYDQEQDTIIIDDDDDNLRLNLDIQTTTTPNTIDELEAMALTSQHNDHHHDTQHNNDNIVEDSL